MAQIRDIKKRMKAVGNIRRITKTMQMIATSKFARAQARAVAARPFTEGVFQLVREVGSRAGDVEHPLLQAAHGAEGKPQLLLVLASDRGLCGAYNANVLRTALQRIRQEREGPRGVPRVELVGKKAFSFMRFAGVRAAAQHTHFGDRPRREDVDRLADEFMQRFIAGEVSSAHVAYMRFISAGRQRPEILQLLPLRAPEGEADGAQGAGPQAIYEFSPPAQELLAELLPVAVRATLNQCFNDAVVSEHVARMVAMKAATDNAGKMGKLLTRTYNRARQAQITTELTEIISGAAALE